MAFVTYVHVLAAILFDIKNCVVIRCQQVYGELFFMSGCGASPRCIVLANRCHIVTSLPDNFTTGRGGGQEEVRA